MFTGHFDEYLHTYGSPLHSEVKLEYLSNDSDWLQVGETWFDFLEAVGDFILLVTVSKLALAQNLPPVQ